MKVTVTVRVGSHPIPKPNLSQARRASRKQREAQARAELESASFAQILSRESGASSGRLPAELQAKVAMVGLG